MRFKSLSQLKRPELHEIVLGTLPQHISMAHYAKQKAFKINELVHLVHEDSFEWYGFTIAHKDYPELIVDIGLPRNDHNMYQYTSIGAEKISDYQDSLLPDTIINGWIHSHGNLDFEGFSSIDDINQLTVLDYVTAFFKKPVAKREIIIQDLSLLTKARHSEEDLEKGSVSIITDVPVSEARILETIYGGFCYSIVIGDEGWHKQQIHYKRRGILSGQTSVSKIEAEMLFVDTGRFLSRSEIDALCEEVKVKLQPITAPPPERIERM